MMELIASPLQRRFDPDKRDTHTAQCRGCKVLNWRNGGCSKDRFALSRDGEPGRNCLCPGLELFFAHTGPTFNVMAQLRRQDRPPADVMAWVADQDARRSAYRPCACGSGSGRKFRFRHGDRAPASPFSGVDRATRAGGSVMRQGGQ